MVIGTLEADISVPGSNSLKDKRQVVKSMVTVIRNRFNVSAAETGHLDSHRRAELAFACVSNDQAVVNRTLDKIMEYIESNPLIEVVGSDLQFV